MKKLSLIVPVYNNEGSLPPLIKALFKQREKLLRVDVALELFFVDDGSNDGSWGELLKIKEAYDEVKLIKLSRNFGAVHASKTGLKFVTGDCFMIIAADLQDPPELITEMVKRWLNGSMFVICERVSRDDPISSKAFSFFYYKLLNFLVIRDYPEGGFDMALMDRALLDPLKNSSKNIFTPLLAYWLGYKPDVIRYHRPQRVGGKSGWTFRKKFTAFLDVMLGFSVAPIRIISGVGVIVAVLSFTYGVSVVINAMMGNVPIQGFAVTVSLLSFLLGLIIIMLGVIGEYLWRIFEEVNKRPETVIEKIV